MDHAEQQPGERRLRRLPIRSIPAQRWLLLYHLGWWADKVAALTRPRGKYSKQAFPLSVFHLSDAGRCCRQHWESPPASLAHASPFVQPSPGDIVTADWLMSSAADNLRKGHANLSFPFRTKWDHDSSDSDFCCADASPAKGGPPGAFVLFGCNGQGASGWTAGPEGFSCMATTSNVTLEKLFQSYFPAQV